MSRVLSLYKHPNDTWVYAKDLPENYFTGGIFAIEEIDGKLLDKYAMIAIDENRDESDMKVEFPLKKRSEKHYKIIIPEGEFIFRIHRDKLTFQNKPIKEIYNADPKMLDWLCMEHKIFFCGYSGRDNV